MEAAVDFLVAKNAIKVATQGRPLAAALYLVLVYAYYKAERKGEGVERGRKG